MERSLGCREMEAERNPIKLSRVKERNGTERKGKDLGREGERECVCINLWNNGTERRENERK